MIPKSVFKLTGVKNKLIINSMKRKEKQLKDKQYTKHNKEN